MPSPLPPGCKFYIWPERSRHRKMKPYLISFHGHTVQLSEYQAQIMFVLIANKGKRLTVREIARELYSEHECGGPEYQEDQIRVSVFNIVAKFRKEGLSLDLKSPHTHIGYIFGTVDLIENWERPESAIPAPRRKKQHSQRKLREKQIQYETFQRNSSDWTFTARQERNRARISAATNGQNDRR